MPCLWAAQVPTKDGSQLVGAGAIAGAHTDKGLRRCVRALLPAAVLPPSTGQLAFQVVGELGGGAGSASSYGASRLLLHRRTGDLVASRWIEYNKGVVLSRSDEREIINHRRLGHPHVLGFREVYLADARPDPNPDAADPGTGADSHLVIVTEHASGGTLGDAVAASGRLGEAEARRLFRQLVDGLAHCHSRGVVHRALSVDTLLLTGSAHKPVLKIAGFGMSKSAIEESMPKTRVPTAAVYTPPELLAAGYGGRDPYDGPASDAWSAGVCLFYMLAGQLPFVKDAGALTRRDLACIAGARYTLPPGVHLSDDCRNLLARLLVADPKQRLRVSDMQRHP
ncbi:hypothetical protein WJX81_004493 [Elliptochloris bilobata]|uniref:Protein kinase domain-containing protein n=1 Tax=Elliptochloris bilobata TaxID=381761 RepID=A0AAW1S7G5_9CHLO